MERFKEIIGLAAITVFFCFATWALTSSYMEDYNLTSAKSESVKVIEKSGAKGLFTSPSYYVRVELPGGKESKNLNRISKKQMMEIEKGDSLSGYLISPSNFSTVHDIIMDSIFYLTGILVLGFLAFCCLVATVLTIPLFDQMEQKSSYKRYVRRNRKKQEKGKNYKQKRTGWRLTGVIVLIFLLFAGRFLVNLARKLLPFGKTETDSMIFDRYSDVTYRKYEDSIYELTINFENQAGQNIQVIKDVSRHTYQQYDIGDKLPITYAETNPYDVFVRSTSISDVLQLLMTWELLVYALLLLVSAFIIWAFYDSQLKEKWQKRRAQ